jgi:hypothetical protein
MTTSQKEVLHVLNQYGPLPDTALVPIAQHILDVHQSSSGIRTRRSELTSLGEVEQVSTITLPSGRTAKVWDVA